MSSTLIGHQPKFIYDSLPVWIEAGHQLRTRKDGVDHQPDKRFRSINIPRGKLSPTTMRVRRKHDSTCGESRCALVSNDAVSLRLGASLIALHLLKFASFFDPCLSARFTPSFSTFLASLFVQLLRRDEITGIRLFAACYAHLSVLSSRATPFLQQLAIRLARQTIIAFEQGDIELDDMQVRMPTISGERLIE